MKKFIEYINGNFPLTNEIKVELENRMKSKIFEKGQDIVNAYKTCKNLYFLETGLIKAYFISDNGKEVIFRFFSEGELFTSLESFINQKPTPHAIKALESTKVSYISKTDLEDLSKIYEPIKKFYQFVLNLANANAVKRFSDLITNNATARYQEFLQENGALMLRIPLSDLAKYLGITQVSLSRIRGAK